MSEQKSLAELEQELADANKRAERAWKSLSNNFSHDGPQWEEYAAANHDVLSAERRLAAAKDEEHVVPVGFPVQWDTGAPCPYLLKNDYRTFVTFFLREHDPDWDGTYVSIRNPASSEPASIAVVEFKHCLAAKMGSPNDEVHDGHPWAGKGLDSYTAQEVIHSRWLAEIEAINSVHRSYDASLWQSLHHYVLWFHDSTFECIAESFEIELHSESLTKILADLCERLLD